MAPKPPKKGSKNGLHFHNFLDLFWDYFVGPFWGGQNPLKKGTKNGSPRSRCFLGLTGPAAEPKREIHERGEESQAAGIIFRKRRGGIRPLREGLEKAFERPSKGF